LDQSRHSPPGPSGEWGKDEEEEAQGLAIDSGPLVRSPRTPVCLDWEVYKSVKFTLVLEKLVSFSTGLVVQVQVH
jgi:hypothetical protein